MHARTERRHTARLKQANHVIAAYRYTDPNDGKLKKLPQSVKSLYTHLWALDGHRSLRYGYLYRTIKQLSKETGMSRTTIINGIADLEEVGVLKTRIRAIKTHLRKTFTNRITGFKLKG